MARCDSCNKFTALTFEEPEIQNDIAIDGTIVTVSVRIVRTSECCGEEKKEASFDLEEEIDPLVFAGHLDPDLKALEGHEIEIEADDPEQIEEGGGRFAKSYFGASITYCVRCSCQPEDAKPLYENTFSDKIAASQMDEC